MAQLSTKTPKTLAEAPGITIIPPPHGNAVIPQGLADPSDPKFSIPVFDFAALTAGSPEERSKLLSDLGEVCQNWGFFILTNHGVPESLMKEMMEACDRLFQLPEEIKKKRLDPLNYSTTYIVWPDNTQNWRELYKVPVHPHFHAVDDSVGFSEASKEFGKRTREVAVGLIEAISESLDLEADYIHKTLDLDKSFQLVSANYYPPYPQPDLAIGIVPHTDPGLVTLLIENGVSGLQVAHNGKWVKVESQIPNSFYVNLADHLQIMTNGKYKSALHRACVNDRATRMSVALSYGPPLDKTVEPLPKLLTKDGGQLPYYEGMTYKEFFELKKGRASVNNNMK